MNLKEAVINMSSKQIMQSMIDGLKNEHVRVDMFTYGRYDRDDGLCYGCAATNMIVEITGLRLHSKNIEDCQMIRRSIGVSEEFLYCFRSAINYLRCGKIRVYNEYSEYIGMATLPLTKLILPVMTEENYKENLHYYQTYCDSL